jgi:hypothetical protein
MKDSTAVIQLEDNTYLTNMRNQQYSFEMCTAKLYGHSTDTVLFIDTRINAKYWKKCQSTYNGDQHPPAPLVNT